MSGIIPDESSYFAAVAENYDRLQPVIAGRSYGEGLAMIAELIPFDPEEAFLFVELGCGTAEPSLCVVQRFPHAAGTCIDNEQAMLEIAKRKLAGRAKVQEADMTCCEIPPCDVVLSSKAFHHVPPNDLPALLARIRQALRPGGCFILFDHMAAGPVWDKRISELSRRMYRQHVQRAIAAGEATSEEIDARWAFKRQMKAEGKDVEYRHSEEAILDAMTEAGFAEVGIVWRMFADTILVGFVPRE